MWHSLAFSSVSQICYVQSNESDKGAELTFVQGWQQKEKEWVDTSPHPSTSPLLPEVRDSWLSPVLVTEEGQWRDWRNFAFWVLPSALCVTSKLINTVHVFSEAGALIASSALACKLHTLVILNGLQLPLWTYVPLLTPFCTLKYSSAHLHLADCKTPTHLSKLRPGTVSAGKPSRTAFPFFIVDPMPSFPQMPLHAVNSSVIMSFLNLEWSVYGSVFSAELNSMTARAT